MNRNMSVLRVWLHSQEINQWITINIISNIIDYLLESSYALQLAESITHHYFIPIIFKKYIKHPMTLLWDMFDVEVLSFNFCHVPVLSFNFCHVRCSLWIECLPCLNVCENQISITEKLKAVQSVLNLIHYHEYASIFRFKNLKRALKNALEV